MTHEKTLKQYFFYERYLTYRGTIRSSGVWLDLALLRAIKARKKTVPLIFISKLSDLYCGCHRCIVGGLYMTRITQKNPLIITLEINPSFVLDLAAKLLEPFLGQYLHKILELNKHPTFWTHRMTSITMFEKKCLLVINSYNGIVDRFLQDSCWMTGTKSFKSLMSNSWYSVLLDSSATEFVVSSKSSIRALTTGVGPLTTKSQ